MTTDHPHAPFEIIGNGNVWFEVGVVHLLDELKEKVPHRYREVMRYMPKAEYDPQLEYQGRSDGYFSIESIPKSLNPRSMSGKYNEAEEVGHIKDTYTHFRFVFLHEVAHNVIHGTEEECHEYARTVLREMGEEV